MKKNYLVTGGAGFIGSNIASRLNKSNNVIIFDNFIRGKKDNIDKKENYLQIIKGDITKYKDFSKINSKIDCVCHLAFLNGTKNFYEKPELVLDIGIKGLINVFDFCIRKNIKELILFSSSEVYHKPSKIPTDENERLMIPDIFNPRYSYSAGKILTEIMGINYGKKFFKKLIIIRPHNVYGPNMGNEHVIPNLINKINLLNKDNKNLEIFGNGNETRSFIYIDDFVDAFMKVIKNGKHLNIYNIGNSEEIKIIELVKKISKIMKKEYKILKKSGHEGNTNRRCPDIKKILNLKYKKKISLEKGLRKTINWYLN